MDPLYLFNDSVVHQACLNTHPLAAAAFEVLETLVRRKRVGD